MVGRDRRFVMVGDCGDEVSLWWLGDFKMIEGFCEGDGLFVI